MTKVFRRWDGPRSDYEPLYPDSLRRYFSFGKNLSWEGDPWYETDKSWFKSSYIHAGISGPETTYYGPDAAKLLSDTCMNDVYNWKAGTCKHLVQLDEDGLIANHALFMKDADDVYRTTAGCPFPVLPIALSGKYDVKLKDKNVFTLQFSGPKSLTILEKVTQTDLHDLKFLEFRTVRIPGFDTDIEVNRIGMSGTLAYELRGEQDWGPDVYNACFEAGKEYGIKRLGWRDYAVNHTFGGFPQMTLHWEMSVHNDPVFQESGDVSLKCTGSVDPADTRARFRTPVEVDWEWMAKFNHEFTGREALEKEMANPKRKLVTLEFNNEDIIDVYASQFTEEPYKYMEMPCAVHPHCGGHQDYVTDKDGTIIGLSSVPTYSSHYKVTAAHAILDIPEIEEGREVIVKWGDYGAKQKDLRATIRPFPYIRYIGDVQDNRDYDLSTIPSGLD